MAERDLFELDLAAFLRAYAEDAPTQVRPAELARQFATDYPHRRSGFGRWGFAMTPALAWVLLLAGLLLALVVGGLVAGARRPDLGVVIAPSPTSTAMPTATPAPTPTSTPWSSGKAAAVTGITDCGTVTKDGVEQTDTAPYTLTGRILACTVLASDPRVSGPGSLVLNVAGWDPTLFTAGTNGVTWSYQEIKGPDGTWTGRNYGLYDKDGILHNYGVFVGSGAYKGLIYICYGTVPANTYTATTVGVIQPGDPPPGFPVTPFAGG